MEILKKVDWNVLNEYIENNLIVSNKHPEYDIWILNYSQKAQFSKLWDLYTTSCRGLIIDAEGNILARPMKKFKNYEEYDPSEIDMTQSFEVFEKMDGSMIVIFWYNAINQWVIASRGSFISEQAMEAKKILGEKITSPLNYLNKFLTYIFEIIYMTNRIVVNYGDMRDLVLLTVIDTKTGEELDYKTMTGYNKYFTIVKKYDLGNIKDLSELKKLEEDNKEGFVVKFLNGFRVKVKFSEYVRLHSIVTNVSNITVWEHLKNNYDFSVLLEKVPDEFNGWVKKVIDLLQSNYNEIERLALLDFVRIYHINEITGRKEFAEEAMKTKHRSILFKLYDKKPYGDLIWKEIKPSFGKPFKDGYEYIG